MDGTVAATEAARILLGRSIDDVYELIKDKVSFQFEKAAIQRKIPHLVTRINNLRKVKTLWQMERPVDLESFYCPSNTIIPLGNEGPRITHQPTRKRKTIDDLSDFGDVGNIVIRGIAGQGKSMFLRHLLIREFEKGLRIPVFVELRKIKGNETLLEHINRFLDVFGLDKIDNRLFKVLTASGKFVFFLDAFDEIPEEQKQILFSQIENLASGSPTSQFVVTTRPDTLIEMSPLFTVTTLDYLENKEYQSLVRKLSENSQTAKALIQAIEEKQSTLADLLCTPLLVTLLIIEYASFQKLPQRMSEFYETIFDVLLQRHDGTKPGFVRKRLCSINDRQYRSTFDAFCFESMKSGKSLFTGDEIKGIISKAIQTINLTEDPMNFLEDISKATCLVLREGREYHFIHNTVKEYYAGSFIKNRPDSTVTIFYGKCISDTDLYYKWREVLEFLSDIDKYRYCKYYLLPLCHLFFNADDECLSKGYPLTTIQLVKQVLGSCLIGLGGTAGHASLLQFKNMPEIINSDDYVDKFFEIDYSELISKIESKAISIHLPESAKEFPNLLPETVKKKTSIISVSQIIDEGILVPELTSIASEMIIKIYQRWEQAYKYVKAEEAVDVNPLSL